MAATCPVVPFHSPTPEELAFLAADYEKSASLYSAALTTHPNDPQLTSGLVRVLLHQQKLQEAADTVTAALVANAGSAILLTARAEVEYRRGEPWAAAETIAAAFKSDPCLPRLHLVFSRIASLNSHYATARKEILLAHKLDPSDTDILGEWIGTLPLRERIAQMESYMAMPTGDDPEEKHRELLYLEHMKKTANEPHKACRLVSTATSTEIPFVELMWDATHIRAFGLEVKFNQHAAHLEIDTGAGGLVVSRSVAQHAGLKPFSQAEIGGIGDAGNNTGYTAFADSIQIGNLEFQDCMVEVVDNKHMMEIDGLIGMDVFSKFLVTLNYPGHKLSLGPLPPRPGEAVVAPALGSEDRDDDDLPKASAAAQPAPADPSKPAVTKGPFDRYVAPEMKEYTPVYRFGHSLMLPVELNRSKMKLFILDTGAWATSIAPGAAREVTKVHSDSNYHVTGLSGDVKKMYTADEVTFAFAKVAQKIDGVPSFDISNISKDIGLEIAGFLGARTLELTTIHIDYRDGLVKFDYDPKTVSHVRPQF